MKVNRETDYQKPASASSLNRTVNSAWLSVCVCKLNSGVIQASKLPWAMLMLPSAARAYTWQAMLDSGEINSISALATRFHQ